MAYDTKELKAECLKAIQKNNLIFIEDIVDTVGIDITTYYSHFPKDSKDYKELFKELKKNKIAMKVGIRKKWNLSTNAKDRENLYRILANDKEIKRLTKQDLSHSGNIAINFNEEIIHNLEEDSNSSEST